MTTFEKINKVATTLSLLAVPLLLAYFGNSLQKQNSDNSIAQEYVKLAIGIIKNPSENDEAAKDWALKILTKFSPVQLNAKNRVRIENSLLSSISLPEITPCERLSFKSCKPTTNGEFYDCAVEISKNLEICADKIDTLIDWQKNNKKNIKNANLEIN